MDDVPLSVIANEPWATEIVLAICTRNRGAQLDVCLSYAIAQECDLDWGILLVDSASTDETAEVISRWVSRFSGRIRSLRLEQPGTGRARAAAVNRTSAPIIAFTDDDCYVAPNFLQSVLETFGSNEDLGAIGGRILLHDPEDYPITICESTESRSLQPRSVVQAGFIQGANMAFRRNALLQAGNFDARVGPGTPFCCEDVDIIARVNSAGWQVAYAPEPTVRHHHGRRTQREVASLRRTYDRGRGAFYTKMILAGEWRYLKHWLVSIWTHRFSMSYQEIMGGIQFALKR